MDKHWDGPGLEAWRGAWTPWEAADALDGLAAPWCVVGGWAIDLFLGVTTRPHDDLEIAIPSSELAAIRAHLPNHRFHAVFDGEIRALAHDQSPPPQSHQTWVLDPGADLWRLDVMREPGDHDLWVFRRDPSITAPRAAMIGRRDGVPFLRPEGALLYKAASPRPKDEADFAACAPRLDPDARAWLRHALAIHAPLHPWLDRLT